MLSPSGDQAGPEGKYGLCVSSVMRPLPSAPMIAIDAWSSFLLDERDPLAVGRPVRFLRAGPRGVTLRRPDPLGFIVKIAQVPFACCCANASLEPSGDQAGLISAAGSWVRRLILRVAALTAKRS